MSSSYSCECELRELAEKLSSAAYELEQAADVLKALRDVDCYKEQISSAKKWAKDWMKR